MSVLFEPKGYVAADFIPFYYEDQYHLFYLSVPVNAPGEHSPSWRHVVTRDFVTFEEEGEIIDAPPVPQNEMYTYTGSVIEKDGAFHMYYTGRDSDANEGDDENDKHPQAVYHAVSHDLQTWEKDDGFKLAAGEGYVPHIWRAPFVFWNPEANEYNMLLAASRKNGAAGHRGCIALASSPDLESWTVQEPFWAPDMFTTHESPNLFRLGDWWYLVYTTYDERRVVHYRMSRTLEGPWRVPDRHALDAGAFYSAKTAGTDKQRYCFGWLPNKKGEKDGNPWQWGGSLIVYELHQQKDGQLSLKLPDSLRKHFSRQIEIQPKSILGDWEIETGSAYTASYERFSALYLGPVPKTGLLEIELEISEQTTEAGVLLRADKNLNWYYQLHLDRVTQRIRLERWPRPWGDLFTLERALEIKPKQVIKLQILIDESRMIAFANGTVSLCGRLYENKGDGLVLYVTEGSATFHSIRLMTP